MKTSIATSALLGVIAHANQLRPEGQYFAQVITSPPPGESQSATYGLKPCEDYEEANDTELNVNECLRVLALNDLNAEDANRVANPNVTENAQVGVDDENTEVGHWTLENITEEAFDDWVGRYTAGQAYCWIKYSDAYGYDSVNDWGIDPFLEGDHFSFLMPNSKKYEHFYNDPDCNQIFRMGRGRTQPDAITFNDVNAWDYNSLLITNRFSVTPWVSHDQMVIQMFGTTDQCVAVRVDEEAMGRGLVDGTFRIEYKNATGVQAVTGSDFDRTDNITAPVTDGSGLNDGLLEANVCIDRTPHYLAVCQDDPLTMMVWDSACPNHCSYFPDWKTDDATAPIDMYGNYTVPCSKRDVNTFNGKNLQDDYSTTTDIEPQRVNALVFEDGCDADSFVLADGQVINVQGNLTGPLEVEWVENAYPDTDSVVFEFYNDPENPWLPYQVTKADLTGLTAPTEHMRGYRFFVYSQHNLSYVCYKPCESSSSQELVCTSDDSPDNAPPRNVLNLEDASMDVQWIEAWSVKGSETGVKTNNPEHGHIISGAGDDMINGTSDELEILEDFGGNDMITANSADDLIISRGGGEIITGKGDGDATVQTVRVYPTHEKDHYFGAKDPGNLRQCTKMTDAYEWTNFELVLDDPWYENAEYTNDDDYCALLVPGWELQWYWSDDWDDGADAMVDIWFSRTGAADFCFSDSSTECRGPYESSEDLFCLSYWVQCEKPAPSSGYDYGADYSVANDLVAQAWAGWFGW